jgi:hypothetical protein
MGKIQNDKSMVIALLACHPDTCTTRTRCNVGAIDTHVGGSIAGSDQAIVLRSCLVHIRYIPISSHLGAHKSVR